MTYSNTATEQRSLDWYRDRLGRITGSCVGDIIGKGRAKDDIFTKAGIAYLTSVAAERMLPDYIVGDDVNFAAYLDEVNVASKAMRIGTERESEARDLYMELSGNPIEECGCIPHPTIDGYASSPDGLVRDEAGCVAGVIEIKCPKPATYLEYLSNVRTAEQLKTVNAQYYWQCMSHMAVTGAGWCDFIAYCPYISTPLHVVRIPFDADAVSALIERLRLALAEVEKIVANAQLPG